MRVSTLTLRFVVPAESGPDWPAVQILVDGREAFVDRNPGWRGFDPGEMLAEPSPLLPSEPPRRVALYLCSCGVPGCGSLAGRIVASADGRRVSWEDFRSYTGVFDRPTAPDADDFEGRPLPVPDLHFDRDQYVAEVERAGADRSWETPRRLTARLVADGLRPRGVVLHPDLRFAWASPDGKEAGVMISFEAGDRRRPDAQQVLVVPADATEPPAAARQVLDRLAAIPPEEWAGRYGWRPGN